MTVLSAAVGHQIAGPVTGLVPHMRLLSQVGRGDGQRLRYLLRTRQSFAELHQHDGQLIVRAATEDDDGRAERIGIVDILMRVVLVRRRVDVIGRGEIELREPVLLS